VLFVAAAAVLTAQDAGQSGQYQGVSNPPPDDQIITQAPPQPKPPAGQPAYAPPEGQPQYQVQPQYQSQPQPTSVDPSLNYPSPGDDSGTVRVMPSDPGKPGLSDRAYANDPDGDIVHPHPLRPGEVESGTMIRVRLLDRLSTAETERGTKFRTRVASDVLQDGQVLIPAGAEIDGKVSSVSSGHAGGHGSMRLEPETVILPDGSRYRLFAETTGAPGSRAHVGEEGAILPNSRLKRDGVEYGGAVGAGVVTGAIVAGPAGALTGGLIGAGLVTAHLLISHPQATLETGTTLLFTLTERLNLVASNSSGN